MEEKRVISGLSFLDFFEFIVNWALQERENVAIHYALIRPLSRPNTFMINPVPAALPIRHASVTSAKSVNRYQSVRDDALLQATKVKVIPTNQSQSTVKAGQVEI